MIDDELLDDDDDLVGAGIPILGGDDDGDVGVLPEEDEDELADLTIKGENGEDIEEDDL